jgi:hypothetical protein
VGGGRFGQWEAKVGVNTELSSSGSIVAGGVSVLVAVAQEDLTLKNLGCT